MADPDPATHESRAERAAAVTGEMTRSLHKSAGGYELAFAPVILALLGLWLDRTLGTVPVFMIAFFVLGVSGVFAKLYYAYRNEMADHRAASPWSITRDRAAADADREAAA